MIHYYYLVIAMNDEDDEDDDYYDYDYGLKNFVETHSFNPCTKILDN